MTERPIIFSSSMVKAILEGRKTQTRLIIKLPHNNPLGVWEATTFGGPGTYTKDGQPYPERAAIWHTRTGTTIVPPYAVGDLLWVREACALWMNPEGKVVLPPDGEGPAYRASMTDAEWRALRHDQRVMAGIACGATDRSTGNWAVRPSIHMPRWASRITLEVTAVKVERLQEISEQDAKAEGIFEFAGGLGIYGYDKKGTPGPHCCDTARDTFACLWSSIHGPGSWDANPWVVAISFEKVSG